MQVDYVRVGHLGDKKVHLIPADEKDPQKVPITRTKRRKLKLNRAGTTPGGSGACLIFYLSSGPAARFGHTNGETRCFGPGGERSTSPIRTPWLASSTSLAFCSRS